MQIICDFLGANCLKLEGESRKSVGFGCEKEILDLAFCYKLQKSVKNGIMIVCNCI